MLNSFRVAWVMGRYGGGKTLGSFELAHELYKSGRYRYILSNCNSVWTDNPEKVVLRDGAYVDAIVILDEAGLFLRMSRDADRFLLGLRKLNITILCPSVLPVSTKVKALQVQRVLDGHALGLPVWVYEYRLNIGSQKEKSKFAIYRPDKIYGIYDTLDYPTDDLYLSEWFEYWMVTAKESRPDWCTWGRPPQVGKNKRDTGGTGQDPTMDNLRGELEEAIEASSELQDALSFYADEKSRKGNKNRR